MISWRKFRLLTLDQKIKTLFEHGSFVMAIRYYNYKVNLYVLGNKYVEVFVNHKHASIERIALLDSSHSRMKFYSDQIKLPSDIK